MDANTGTLIGRVVRVPKVFKNNGKKPVAKFTVEVPREFGKRRDFVNVTAFDHALDAEKWLQAGTEVKLTYTVQSYTRLVNGQTDYGQDLVVTHLVPLSGSRKPGADAATEIVPTETPAIGDSNREFGGRPHPDSVLA